MSILSYTPLLAQGMLVTIGAWLTATAISLVIGTIVGIASCTTLTTPARSVMVRLFTFVTKGVPAYVHILIAYFVVPALLGITIPGIIAATGALALCSSGYVTEIIRAGINAIPAGQWDASYVLGYSRTNTLRRIIMPQAFAAVTPSLVGECEQLLKSTSLLAAVGITDLTRAGMNIISRELNPIPVYCLIAALYLCYSALLHMLIAYTQKRYA